MAQRDTEIRVSAADGWGIGQGRTFVKPSPNNAARPSTAVIATISGAAAIRMIRGRPTISRAPAEPPGTGTKNMLNQAADAEGLHDGAAHNRYAKQTWVAPVPDLGPKDQAGADCHAYSQFEETRPPDDV